MKVNNVFKIVFDFFMMTVLLVAYCVAPTGILIHEIVGLGIFLLFIIHLAYNFKWIKSVSKKLFDKTLSMRVKFIYAVDLLLLASFVVVGYSGIMISRFIFTFEKSQSSFLMWFPVHLISATVTILLVAIHLGLHFDMIISTVKTKIHIPFAVIKVTTAVILVTILTAGVYGEIATIKNGNRHHPRFATISTLAIRSTSIVNRPRPPESGEMMGRQGMAGRDAMASSEGMTRREGMTSPVGMARREGMTGREGAAGREGMATREGMVGREGIAGREGMVGREGLAGREGMPVRGNGGEIGVQRSPPQKRISIFDVWVSVSNFVSCIILCSIITVLIDKKMRKKKKLQMLNKTNSLIMAGIL